MTTSPQDILFLIAAVFFLISAFARTDKGIVLTSLFNLACALVAAALIFVF